MKATQIFGTHLLPMMEYVGWTKTPEGYNHIHKHFKEPIGAIDEAHKLLSQPMDISLFVRGDEPRVENAFGGENNRLYRILKNKYDNWKPLLKWNWDCIMQYSEGFDIYAPADKRGQVLLIGSNFEFQSINDFANHCYRQGIKLELNEDFEI